MDRHGGIERSEALAIPGGFPSVRDHQVEQLKKLAALVEADEPDLEAERLFQECDMDGFANHMRAHLKDVSNDEGGA